MLSFFDVADSQLGSGQRFELVVVSCWWEVADGKRLLAGRGRSCIGTLCVRHQQVFQFRVCFFLRLFEDGFFAAISCGVVELSRC